MLRCGQDYDIRLSYPCVREWKHLYTEGETKAVSAITSRMATMAGHLTSTGPRWPSTVLFIDIPFWGSKRIGLLGI